MLARIVNLGCRVNQYEGEALSDMLSKHGYHVTDESEADIVIVNSCAVTHIAARKTRQVVRRMRRENPDAILVLCGCYAQVDSDEASSLGADIVLGTRNKSQIIEILSKYLLGMYPNIFIKKIRPSSDWDDLEIDQLHSRTRAFIKIQDGCDHFCSYCIVPFARGSSISRSSKAILHEAEKLIVNGASEIVLTGVNIGSYSNDGISLASLIDKISSLNGLKRLRFGSIEPFSFNNELLSVLHETGIFCHHLHIPMQSGSDRILRLMNRGYNCSAYSKIIQSIRDKLGSINITTDVMVGFPGETDVDFDATISLIGSLGINALHVFIYSTRSGTKAESMPDRISDYVARKRSDILIELSQKKSYEYKRSFLGKHVNILVEETAQDGSAEGFIPEYVRARLLNAPKNGFDEEQIIGGVVRGFNEDYLKVYADN